MSKNVSLAGISSVFLDSCKVCQMVVIKLLKNLIFPFYSPLITNHWCVCPIKSMGFEYIDCSLFEIVM